MKVFLALFLSIAACPGNLDFQIHTICQAEHEACLRKPEQYADPEPATKGDCYKLMEKCIRKEPLLPLEFQLCSDSTSDGAGNPCINANCVGDNYDDASAVGTDCTARNTTVTMTHDFYTYSPGATLMHLWLRIIRDDDLPNSNWYNCSLSGISFQPTGLTFELTKLGLKGSLNGDGCASTPNKTFCWAKALNGLPFELDQGPHTLTCSCTTTSPTTRCGFDGIIFTTDAAFIPEEANPSSGSCDSDLSFSEGTCFANWGPNRQP